jgi:hypothetical protein
MLSSVLRSRRAVEVNIAIMRAFVQLRRLMDTNRDLPRKIEALEKKYDEQFAEVFAAIKELIAPPVTPRNRSASIRDFFALSSVPLHIKHQTSEIKHPVSFLNPHPCFSDCPLSCCFCPFYFIAL